LYNLTFKFLHRSRKHTEICWTVPPYVNFYRHLVKNA
jgi:hypothetical protein